MRYTKFEIQNFKGIKNTVVDLKTRSAAGVFSLVGLNESGKTTILEAIHSFSPDEATNDLVGAERGHVGVQYRDRVPRHQISDFSGDVSVKATVLLNEEDKRTIQNNLKKNHSIFFEDNNISDEVVFERKQVFENGDFKKNSFQALTEFSAKTSRQRKFQVASGDVLKKIIDEIYSHTPDIAYFPTFVFNFPEKIFLTNERGNKISQFYRTVFQDILDFDGRGNKIDESIIRRLRAEEMKLPWVKFMEKFLESDAPTMIQHIMDRASAAVTEVVFGRWNQIFSEDAGEKEIVISFYPTEGKRKNESGEIYSSDEHDCYIDFKIKDGTRRYDVRHRSLGFRWFFAFMLFTQFRVSRESSRPLLFLFDEPASNLHAAAQSKLLDSFPRIATNDHMLIYSTHSHYMIEPKWLEQALIVTNRSDAPSDSILEAAALDDESLDIKAEKYRVFANANPIKTSYFQPILDRLEVIPSRFDFNMKSIIVEGKSDYYVIRYAISLLDEDELPIVPAFGAGTFGGLVGLHLGWGIRSVYMLDGDDQGIAGKNKYIEEYGVPNEQVLTISDILDECSFIEDLLNDEAKDKIKLHLELSTNPSKKQIREFFQEHLASDSIIDLGDHFREKAKSLIEGLRAKLET